MYVHTCIHMLHYVYTRYLPYVIFKFVYLVVNTGCFLEYPTYVRNVYNACIHRYVIIDMNIDWLQPWLI